MRWIERPGKCQGNCARAVPGTPRGLTGGSAPARTQLKVPIQSVVCLCLSTARPTAWPAGTCSLEPSGPQSTRATPHPTAQPAGTCSLNFAGPGYPAGGGTPSPTEPRARHDTLPIAAASTSRVGRPGRSGRPNCGGSRRGDCEAGWESGMEPPGGGRCQRAEPGCLGGRARPEGGSGGPRARDRRSRVEGLHGARPWAAVDPAACGFSQVLEADGRSGYDGPVGSAGTWLTSGASRTR